MNWTRYIVSLNFLLSILGYQLAMGLLSPLGKDLASGENVFFTYPYRCLQIIVAFLAFWSVRKQPLPRLSWKIGAMGVFWALYFVRAFWDLFIDPPYHSPFVWALYRGNEWYFVIYVLLDFLPLFAILKGWQYIDFTKVLKWILILGGIGLVFSSVNMHAQADASWAGELGRVAATRMLHTQALGNFGCYVAIASFWMFFNSSSTRWKLLSVLVALLAVYMMLKAGSRGPVFGFSVVLCAWFSLRNKNVAVSLLAGLLAVGLILLLQDHLLKLIQEISPTMAERITLTIGGGDTSGRDTLWASYWAECLRNPLFGFQLERIGYPHNMFIDGFMMFGLIAGWIVTILIITACVSVAKALKMRIPNSLGQLTQSFTQSGFSGLAIQAPLLLLFIYEAQGRTAVPPPTALNTPSKHEFKSSSPL